MQDINNKPLDILIEGGTALTLSPNREIIEEAVIGIADGLICFISEKGDPTCRGLKAKDRIRADHCLIMPGLVNTHTHLPMVCFRGLADDLPLMKWLTEHIFPAEAKYASKQMAHDGALLAMAEMILSGTTTFCDAYFFESQVAQTALACGLRAVVCRGFADFAAPDHSGFGKIMAAASRFVERWQSYAPMVTPAFFCHSPYTCSPETLGRVKKASREAGLLYLIHLLENRDENDILEKRYGKPSVTHLLHLGVLDEKTVAVHCNWLTEGDIDVFADLGVGVSHNPRSSMKLAAGIAPVPRMIEKGIAIGLGTDGAASNNNLDMIEEMNVCAKIHKVATLDPAVMDARSIVYTATLGGARLLGLGSLIGSLETGKQADIIILDMDQPHLTPLYHPYSQVVYAARGADVKTSIVAGRILMRDRKLLTLDVDAAMKRVRGIARTISSDRGAS